MMNTYRDIVTEYSVNPHDVCTVPKTKKDPKWFYVFAKNDLLYVRSSQLQGVDCSKIRGARKLRPEEFDKMLDLHRRRKEGEAVSKEATDSTRNQVYWYGIFSDMKL